MLHTLSMRHDTPIFRRFLNGTVIAIFILNSFLPNAYAQIASSLTTEVILPSVGQRLNLSVPFNPSDLKGIRIRPNEPLRFDFLIGHGQENLGNEAESKAHYTKLIKYFLAALTMPEKDMWVNLSPYEKQRIIPTAFGQTEMGRDLLGQDYILKQMTASLIYPEDELGKKFWAKVYMQARQKYGTDNIPVNTFNKVWIVPEEAIVYEHNDNAVIIHSQLKVMLEQDYLALSKQDSPRPNPPHEEEGINALGSQIIRELVLPALQKEVNEGTHFAQLRQIYSAMVLATWYKKSLKETLLGQIYADKAKVKGVEHEDKNANEKIYQQYLQAFKKGVYNYIKEEPDPVTGQIIPRKYFSGGFNSNLEMTTKIYQQLPQKYQNSAQTTLDQASVVTADFNAKSPSMNSQEDSKMNFKLEEYSKEIVLAKEENQKFVNELRENVKKIQTLLQTIEDNFKKVKENLNVEGVFFVGHVQAISELRKKISENKENQLLVFLSGTLSRAFPLVDQSDFNRDWDINNRIATYSYIEDKNLRVKLMNKNLDNNLTPLLKFMKYLETTDTLEIKRYIDVKKAVVDFIDPRPSLNQSLDSATVSLDNQAIQKSDVGGIDLDSGNLNLKIKRDGNGVVLPVQMQDLAQWQGLEGLTPVIIQVTPVSGVPLLSALDTREQGSI